MNDHSPNYKYFLSYSGVKLPLNLVSPLELEALGNRNTYFRAAYDTAGRVLSCEKMVYGEIELRHDYEYDEAGNLRKAVIEMDGEETVLNFDS